ncbi:MAG TPA: hypothetical protein VJ995_09415 [Geothermobacteraceae bacterium]|nr:hypothetical protein [Geothermobacteraceae bacterium]
MRVFPLSFLLLLLPVAAAHAGEADVLRAEATRNGDGSYRFQVTVSHRDKGWQHYADKWEIVDATGAVLATRVLLHPHTEEQPFTRSLSGVQIPAKTGQVTVRAHDSVHGYGGTTVTVELPR